MADSIEDPSLRPIPRDPEGPLFNEPWEAQALAIAYRLIEEGRVTRQEWAEALGAAITKAQAEGDPDEGGTYYRHVLAAIEALTVEKGLTDPSEISTRKQDWKDAYLSTPHGQPVELKK
ncbi:MAG: nitrile hydratase accessory protein [Alphaproteobacteria bacterium]